MGMRWSRMSWSEKNELWQRWRRGETLDQIAQALLRGSSALYEYVGSEGGVAPQPRRRSRLALTTTEREEISRQLARGESIRAIGCALGRAASTISREIGRNHGRADDRAGPADRQAWLRGRRPKRCRLATHSALRRVVAAKLALQWSPQQISGWLRSTFPSNPALQVSHETIYRSLFIQSRGVLKRALRGHLRRQRGFALRVRALECVRSKGRLSMPSRSASDQPRSRIAHCLGIGRATCWKGARHFYRHTG
jgi:IS30 family transposase